MAATLERTPQEAQVLSAVGVLCRSRIAATAEVPSVPQGLGSRTLRRAKQSALAMIFPALESRQFPRLPSALAL